MITHEQTGKSSERRARTALAVAVAGGLAVAGWYYLEGRSSDVPEPVITSDIASQVSPAGEGNDARLELHGNCLEVEGDVPVFNTGTEWDSSSQTVTLANGQEIKVGENIPHLPSVQMPISLGKDLGIGEQALRAVQTCAKELNATDIVLISPVPTL